MVVISTYTTDKRTHIPLLLQTWFIDETAGVQLAKVKRLTELFGPIKEEDNKCVFVNQVSIKFILDIRSLQGEASGYSLINCFVLGQLVSRDIRGRLSSAQFISESGKVDIKDG